jgi:hypothetical protein
MPRTARASVGNVCYHVLNRGNARNEVFHKDGDFQERSPAGRGQAAALLRGANRRVFPASITLVGRTVGSALRTKI